MTSNQDPKIVVDQDYKNQVEQEKERLRQESAQKSTSRGREQMPPPDFALLVTTLATQALASMGAIPDPVENKPVVQLDLAKHMIGLLEMLDVKTKGNLTADEQSMLESALRELRLVFVHAAKEVASKGTGDKPSSIVLPGS